MSLTAWVAVTLATVIIAISISGYKNSGIPWSIIVVLVLLHSIQIERSETLSCSGVYRVMILIMAPRWSVSFLISVTMNSFPLSILYILTTIPYCVFRCFINHLIAWKASCLCLYVLLNLTLEASSVMIVDQFWLFSLISFYCSMSIWNFLLTLVSCFWGFFQVLQIGLPSLHGSQTFLYSSFFSKSWNSIPILE